MYWTKVVGCSLLPSGKGGDCMLLMFVRVGCVACPSPHIAVIPLNDIIVFYFLKCKRYL